MQSHPDDPTTLQPFSDSIAAAPTSIVMEGDVTICTTAEQLQAAVVAGQQHIEVRDHLDLTTLDFPGEFLRDGLLGRVPPTVRSIRVRSCSCGIVVAHANMVRKQHHVCMYLHLESELCCIVVVDVPSCIPSLLWRYDLCEYLQVFRIESGWNNLWFNLMGPTGIILRARHKHSTPAAQAVRTHIHFSTGTSMLSTKRCPLPRVSTPTNFLKSRANDFWQGYTY